jgi:broad specificity phosphatase PhoE
MRTLEVRRHTMRAMPGQHLTQAGIDLARRIGGTIGPFDRVITSTVPRAFETAIAMGFAVDEQLDQLSLMDATVADEIQWDAGFVEWARVINQGGAAARFAHAQADVWRSIVRALPEHGRALIITHGGIVEAGTIGCLPLDTRVAYGAYCGYCEGVRFTFDGEVVANVEILRNDSR